ncbi:hypothetical protein JB92DRAFT_3105370 [Gautieria morchelliformis]|nr:hypothetical protein JB92DRAFT_3105370 [Gautieria morchelliformis]
MSNAHELTLEELKEQLEAEECDWEVRMVKLREQCCLPKERKEAAEKKKAEDEQKAEEEHPWKAQAEEKAEAEHLKRAETLRKAGDEAKAEKGQGFPFEAVGFQTNGFRFTQICLNKHDQLASQLDNIAAAIIEIGKELHQAKEIRL